MPRVPAVGWGEGDLWGVKLSCLGQGPHGPSELGMAIELSAPVREISDFLRHGEQGGEKDKCGVRE